MGGAGLLRVDTVECELDGGEWWRLKLQQGDECVVVVRSEESLKELGRELAVELDTSNVATLGAQLRSLSHHPALSTMFAEAVKGGEKKPQTPWYVDCRVIEGRNLVGLSSSDRVYVTVCLESQPSVRLVTRRTKTVEGNHVWNCDGSFVCDNANTDKLHVTLLTKRNNAVIGKFAVSLRQLLGGPPGPKDLWYNVRDVYDAVCIECDRPLDSSLSVPFGYSSAGLLHLQLEVSLNHSLMAWAKFGVPLRWLPYRVLAGDVLFFSSKKLVTTGTKIATRSRWDHTALVISYKQYRKMYILQSTTSGVEVNEAESVLKGYWSSSRAVGVRRLMADRKGVAQGLSEFAEKHLGKSYNFNFIGGRGKRGKEVAELDRDKLFCSELVAAAFMHVGLLSTVLSASSFLPATLASAKTMLNSGSQLLPLVKFPVPSSKSQDIVWAREERCLRDAFRLSLAGRPLEPMSQAALKLLRSVRKHMTAVVVFPRVARDHTELTLEEGDVVLVLEKDPTAWWTGQHQGSGKIGAFPANHVEFAMEVHKKKMRPSNNNKGALSPDRPMSPTLETRQSPDHPPSKGSAVSPPLVEVFSLAPLLGDCAHCKQPFDPFDVPLVISGVPLHERCLSRYVSQWQDREEVSCFICHIVSHLTVTKCTTCGRLVCAQCGGKDGDEAKESKCRVCKWSPPVVAAAGAFSSSSSSLSAAASASTAASVRKDCEVMIAIHGHQKRSPHELQFFLGDEVELWERLDWGWCVGRHAFDKVLGIFPEAVVQPKGNKKWTFRTQRGGGGRKSPGSTTGSKDTVGKATRHRSLGSLTNSSNSIVSPFSSPGSDFKRSGPDEPQTTTPSPPLQLHLVTPVTPQKSSSRGPAPEVPARPDALKRRISVFELIMEPQAPLNMSASLNRLADDFSGESDSTDEDRAGDQHSGEIDSQEDLEESSSC